MAISGEVLAAFSSVGGVSFAAAAVLGGLLAQRVPVAMLVGRRALLGSELVFAAGGTARLAAAAAAARIFRAPVGDASRRTG
ncbi:hypothetical protein AMPC_00040 [Anaeromyxobacter paludicola]|uniref:Uncharacterized protein n=2 Tax=Anaeromyxobacter paludicola TaxID=2918171 RepID=A0ABN6N1E4_9BACT|nr:hypothetical protein AMPC_00040 [Anaeromyxobacter paludicola]